MGRWVIIPTWKNWSFLFYYEFVMIRRLQKIAAKILLACIALGAMATASNVPSPAPNGVLYDEDRLLSAQEAEFLRALVTEVYLKTDVKIAAVLMNDSRTNETYAYAKEVANKWRLEGNDTKGILVYVSMKERSKHVIASEGFSTSYPNIDFKKIEQKALMPDFRVEKYGRGIINFIWEISGEILAASGQTLSVNPDNLLTDEPFPWQNYIFIGIVFAGLVTAFFYARPQKRRLSSTRQAGFNGNFCNFENFNGGFKSR